MLGQTVSHYRILKKLGEGGMGVVYEAEDLLLGRHVAIKFLTDARREPQFRARFLREARAASTLSHSHIAVIYDYGEAREGDPFIVMELVNGQSLADLLCAGTPLPIARAVEIAEQVAEALAEAHRHGVVHRDIKPSNIIIGEDGEVKVLDFGLAKQLKPEAIPAAGLDSPTLLDAHTASNVIIGTPMYLSPEQALARPVDGRSDLFALGAVLYECLTGRPAFQGATVVEICAQVLHVDPPPPSQTNARISPELDEIVLKVLAKQPAARQQTAEEFLADLRAAAHNLSQANERANTLTLSGFYTAARSGAYNIRRAHWRQPRFFIPLLLALVVAGALAWRVAPAGWLNGRAAPVVLPEALSWYERGTSALRDGSYFQASKMLEQAVSADDEFALAHARLAEALMELDYTDRARDSILRAESLSHEQPEQPQVNKLYFTAVNATARRDFPSAIKAYAELVRLRPQEPQAHADLGRGYEKNDEIDKAIKSYTQATQINNQLAFTYLRLGVLYGRKQELASAGPVFDRAQEINRALGNYEGIAECYYQRGALANKLGKYMEAREHLQRALETSKTTDNLYQRINALLELSYANLNEGNPAQARQYATEGMEAAQANQMESLIPRALIALGNSYFLDGESSKAEEHYQKAITTAQRYGSRRNEATARIALGSLRNSQGKPDHVIREVEPALAFFQQHSYRQDAMRAQLLLGRAARQQGNYVAALKAFEALLQLSQQLGDLNQMSASHEGLGRTYLQQERYTEALTQFEESLRISRVRGDQIGEGFGLMQIGSTLWRLGRYTESRPQLEAALALATRPGGYKKLLAEIHQQRAEMALSQRLFPDALSAGAQALALTNADDADSLIQIKSVLSRARTATGSRQMGERLAAEVVSLAETLKRPPLLAKARQLFAEAMLDSDASRALQAAREAQAEFARAGQQESEWRAWRTISAAARRAGDQTLSLDAAANAERLLAGLEGRWGTEIYGRYLTRPDVAAAR
ncbi:MAG: tetratricopeptide repeat protein [Acidobacteriota bacterium]|nr:tetratricopeptide repeat protein [Acidobacteriota bacterium]